MGEQNVCKEAKKKWEEICEERKEKERDEELERNLYHEQQCFFERKICPKCASRNIKKGKFPRVYKCKDCDYEIYQWWEEQREKMRREKKND